MTEEAVIKKLESIRVSGSKGELWNFEAATIINLILKQQGEIRELRRNVEGYCGLAKQIQEDYGKSQQQIQEHYEQILEDYYNED